MLIDQIVRKNLFLLLVSVVLISSTNLFGQTSKYSDVLENQQKTLQVDFYIDNQIYCSNNAMKFRSNLLIKNVSEKPVVFCKTCFAVGGTYISQNFNLMNEDKYLYDLIEIGWKKLKVDAPLPTQEPFITLKSGESYSIKINTFLENSSENKTILPSGNYVLAQVVRTWTDFSELDKKITEKWKSDGLMFWAEELVTPTAEIIIQKEPKFQKCN